MSMDGFFSGSRKNEAITLERERERERGRERIEKRRIKVGLADATWEERSKGVAFSLTGSIHHATRMHLMKSRPS